MNAYIVTRAYLLALIFGGAAFASLLMATGMSHGHFYGTIGFVLTALVFGAVVSPLFALAIITIRKQRWSRPLADALAGALLVLATLIVLPPFETPAALGDWGWFVACLEGAFVGLCMGALYWFLSGKPPSNEG